jgi:NhaP-type Na+/H+ and K+/H+ antiporter
MIQTIISPVQMHSYIGGASLLDSAKDDPAGFATLLGIGWLYGLVLTVFVGLPLGFLVAFLLRRAKVESLLAYAMAGGLTAFAFSMVLPSRSEFWLAISVTGLLLGISFWFLIRRPLLKRIERP